MHDITFANKHTCCYIHISYTSTYTQQEQARWESTRNQSSTHAHTSAHTAPKGLNIDTCTHYPNPLAHVQAVLYMFLAYFDAIGFLLRTYYALIHFYVYNIYIHMHTCIIASYPLARAQVVIYIFDIGWLTVISFFLTRTYMYTSKLWYSCCWPTILWCYVFLISYSYVYLLQFKHTYTHTITHLHIGTHTVAYIFPTCQSAHIHTRTHSHTRIHAPLCAHGNTYILCVNIHAHTQAWGEREHER